MGKTFHPELIETLKKKDPKSLVFFNADGDWLFHQREGFEPFEVGDVLAENEKEEAELEAQNAAQKQAETDQAHAELEQRIRAKIEAENAEKAAQEQAAQEQAVKEQAVKEQAEKEAAEKKSQEKPAKATK